MPREYVVVSGRPIDLADHLLAAAGINPDFGLRQVWDGGGMQVCDTEGTALLTVMRTKGFDVADDVERLLGATLGPDRMFWTEMYGPLDDSGAPVAGALARVVEGDLFVRDHTVGELAE